MTISNNTLLKIASIGGIITCTTGIAMQWKVKDRVRQSDYYKEAFKELRKHAGAVSLLGEPIKEGGINLKSSNNFCNDEKAHFEIFVKGSKQKGILFFWASKVGHANTWNVTRIELGLENEIDRRLLIKDLNNDIPKQ